MRPAHTIICRFRLVTVALCALVAGTACAPDSSPPAATTGRVVVHTVVTICSGMIPPPGQDRCTDHPYEGQVSLIRARTTVAIATSELGVARFDVAPGTYMVSSPEIAPWFTCTSPLVTAALNSTAEVAFACRAEYV
jgi:hypothetical protein